jgi:RNA polymerase sigma factor (sigma-70 family)
MKKTYAELAALRERKEWGMLWVEALPLVKFTIKRMIQSGALDPHYAREDLLQEGNLSAGKAIRTWEPLEAAFSTWITSNVRGALLNFLAVQSNRGMGSKRVRSKTYALEKKHLQEAAEGSLEEALAEAQEKATFRFLCDRLKGAEYQAIRALVNGATVQECAKELGVNERTVNRLRDTAKRKMSSFYKKGLQLL